MLMVRVPPVISQLLYVVDKSLIVISFKRAFWPSFFICIAIILALVISIINGYILWWASVSVLLSLFIYYFDFKLPINLLLIILISFFVLLITNVVFVRPVPYQDAIYLITFLSAGFLLFSSVNTIFAINSFKVLNGIVVILALWGVIQYLTGAAYIIHTGNRANTIFYTPNTYAACINMSLLPLIIFYLLSENRRSLLFVIYTLSAALIVSQSRGGWISFVATASFIFLFIKLFSLEIHKKRMKSLLIGIAAIFFCFAINNNLKFEVSTTSQPFGSNLNNIIRHESAVSTLQHRFQLFDIAWQQIKAKPLLGHGLHTYQYFQTRDQQEPYIGNKTRFVHNDFLQLWMEIGIFGLLLFLSIPFAIICLLYVNRQRLEKYEVIAVLAMLSAIFTFYIHGLVDFLFYIPFLLLLFGAYLGYINQIFNRFSNKTIALDDYLRRINTRPVIIKCLVGISLIGYLSQPAVAQLYFDKANRDKQKLDIKSALKNYELARRFAPYHEDYYLVEADIWLHAAKATGKPEPANRSDALYIKGDLANPYSVKSLFWRAMLHRDMPKLLQKPATIKEVLSWLESAMQWLPNDQKLQEEYVRTLLLSGNVNLAREQLNLFIEKNPDSVFLKNVEVEAANYPGYVDPNYIDYLKP